MSEDVNTIPHLILILGGARAGKSSYALRLAEERERVSRKTVSFIATAQALDDDMSERIARHRAERPPHWRTIEEPYRICEALESTTGCGVVIVDCLTLFASNWLLRYDNVHECEHAVQQITDRFLSTVRSWQQMIICVSNEVGLGVVPETLLGRTFRDVLGRINQEFARSADEVYMLVAGLSLRLKPNDEKSVLLRPE